jgi:hypothetical protein
LATWDLNTNSDPNTTGVRQGAFPSGHALSINRTTPSAPTGQRGPDGTNNVILLTEMTIQVAGPSGAANVRGRIWDSSGTSLSTSAAATAANNSTFNIGNVVFNMPNVLLDGNTSYRFGVWATADIRAQTSANSAFNVWTDTSIGSTDNWSTGNSSVHQFGSNFSLVGSFEYFLLPSAPSISSISATSSSMTVSWSAPSTNGGTAITDYWIEYKPSFGSTWEAGGVFGPTDSPAVISGLSSSTTYEVRISAGNAVGQSAYGTSSVTTTSGGGTFSFSPAPTPTTTVPNLSGLTLAQANTTIASATLTASGSPVTLGATAENNNLVITGTQSPASGSVVNTGTTVSFSYYSYTPPAQKVSVWNGTSWVVSTPRVWNGSSWVEPTVIRIWNGTSWVNPT